MFFFCKCVPLNLFMYILLLNYVSFIFVGQHYLLYTATTIISIPPSQSTSSKNQHLPSQPPISSIRHHRHHKEHNLTPTLTCNNIDSNLRLIPTLKPKIRFKPLINSKSYSSSKLHS